jgi:hypothetical protein
MCKTNRVFILYFEKFTQMPSPAGNGLSEYRSAGGHHSWRANTASGADGFSRTADPKAGSFMGVKHGEIVGISRGMEGLAKIRAENDKCTQQGG